MDENRSFRGKYQKYDDKTLQEALKYILEDKGTIYSAAKKVSVPKSTLLIRLNNSNSRKAGRQPVLSL
jgi:hypothetical protein